MRVFRPARPLGALLALAVVAACATPGHGPTTAYTLVLRSFSDYDAHAVVRVMAEQFPGYRSHNLVAKDGAVRRYDYRTTAKAIKLEEWLYLLLRDMGFDVRQGIRIRVRGSEIQVDMLSPRSEPAPDPGDGGDEPQQGSWVPVTGDRFR